MRTRGRIGSSALGAGVLAVCLGVEPVQAACATEPGPIARVEKVLDAETVALEGGIEVRLINIVSPRRPLWLKPERKWPEAGRAERALGALVAGREVQVFHDGPKTDRYGRLLGQLYVRQEGEPSWVQGALVEQGHARVQSTVKTRACVRALLKLERAARAGKRGLWRSAFYRVRPALARDDIVKLKNTFAVIEGKVHKHAQVGSRSFLNFEDDWAHDFTVIVRQRSRRLFEKSEIALEKLQGTGIRVRGWISYYNGPMIEVSHPEQIELMNE